MALKSTACQADNKCSNYDTDNLGVRPLWNQLFSVDTAKLDKPIPEEIRLESSEVRFRNANRNSSTQK